MIEVAMLFDVRKPEWGLAIGSSVQVAILVRGLEYPE
jgi:hypothetical protein